MNQIRLRDKSLLRRYEIIGAIAVCILAPVFHFLLNGRAATYLSGCSRRSMKAYGSIPRSSIFHSSFTQLQNILFFEARFSAFLIAKAASMGLILLLMITFFYTYSGMFGVESLIVDIIFTFVLTIIAFIVSYRIYTSNGLGAIFSFGSAPVLCRPAMELSSRRFRPIFRCFGIPLRVRSAFPQQRKVTKTGLPPVFLLPHYFECLSKGREDCNIQNNEFIRINMKIRSRMLARFQYVALDRVGASLPQSIRYDARQAWDVPRSLPARK